MNPSAAAAIRQKLTSLSRYLAELRGHVEVDLASSFGRRYVGLRNRAHALVDTPHPRR